MCVSRQDWAGMLPPMYWLDLASAPPSWSRLTGMLISIVVCVVMWLPGVRCLAAQLRHCGCGLQEAGA